MAQFSFKNYYIFNTLCTAHGVLSVVWEKKKFPTTSSSHCLLCRRTQPWCMTQCSWLPWRPSGPLRWPSAPCSVTATNPGASDRASWTSSKRSVSDEGSNHRELKTPCYITGMTSETPVAFSLTTMNYWWCVSVLSERASWGQEHLWKASAATMKLTKTGYQIFSHAMLLYRSLLTGHALLLKVHKHEDIRYLWTYKFKACGLARLSDWMPTDRNESFDAWVFWSLKS